MTAARCFLTMLSALAPLARGGSVGIEGFELTVRTETDDPALSVSRDGGTLTVDRLQVSLQRRFVFHRLAVARDGRVIFGYDIEVGRHTSAGAGAFSVVLRPLDRAYEDRIRGEDWFPRDSSLSVSGRLVSFVRSKDLGTVKAGERVEIELYRHEATGRRIWDVLELAEHPLARPWAHLPRPAPDHLNFSRVRVLVNGRDETPPHADLSVSGAAVMIALPPHGRFYFARQPLPGYPFEFTARVEGKRLIFPLARGPVLEFVSEGEVLPGGQPAQLWGYAAPARDDDFFSVASANEIKRLLPAAKR